MVVASEPNDVDPSVRFQRLRSSISRLSDCKSLSELYGAAVDVARTEGGFDRGLVLSVRDGYLDADVLSELTDPESDRLRRLALQARIPVVPGSEEAAIIGASYGWLQSARTTGSVLAERLHLAHYVIAPVVFARQVVALLVLDRQQDQLSTLDQALVHALSSELTALLAQRELRARHAQVKQTLRYFTVTMQAVLEEVIESPFLSEGECGGALRLGIGEASWLASLNGADDAAPGCSPGRP